MCECFKLLWYVMSLVVIQSTLDEMKAPKCKPLAQLHATTACTEDARLKYCWLRSTSLGYSQEVVIHLVMHVSGYIHVFKSNIDRRYAHAIAFATYM